MCCWRKTLPSEMRLPVIVSCVLLAAVTPALSDEPINFPRIAAQLSRAQLMESVGALAGFDGRQSGTPGGEAAAAYIVRRLPKAMLQSFPVNTVTIDAPVQVEILSGAQSRSLRNGIDFLPILSGASAPGLSGSVVFVGYGISDAAGGLDGDPKGSLSVANVLFPCVGGLAVPGG